MQTANIHDFNETLEAESVGRNQTETSAANQRSLTPEQEKAIDATERSFGKRGADPHNRLGRKHLCLKTLKVYMQIFRDGEVIGHVQRTQKRGIYDCFENGGSLGLRFNITEAVDLVTNTHKRRNH